VESAVSTLVNGSGLYVDPSWHSSTLTATSFAETFSLQGEDLVECIKVNRGCTSMFCEQLGLIGKPQCVLGPSSCFYDAAGQTPQECPSYDHQTTCHREFLV